MSCREVRPQKRSGRRAAQKRKTRNANRDNMICSEYGTGAVWRIQRRVHGKSIAAEEEAFVLAACAAYVL